MPLNEHFEGSLAGDDCDFKSDHDFDTKVRASGPVSLMASST